MNATKTPVVLVTFYANKHRIGRTRAFHAVTRERLPQFDRNNARPYFSAQAAIAKSGTHQEVTGYFGVLWLTSWETYRTDWLNTWLGRVQP